MKQGTNCLLSNDLWFYVHKMLTKKVLGSIQKQVQNCAEMTYQQSFKTKGFGVKSKKLFH